MIRVERVPGLAEVLTIFTALFAIMNPLGTLPVFLTLTDGLSDKERRQIAAQALTIAFCINAAFAIAGGEILRAFGITLPAFRIAGGILVFVIGFQMVNGSPSHIQHPTQADRNAASTQQMSIAISPLGMPILAGPGTITTAMNFTMGQSWAMSIATVAMLAVLSLLAFLLFSFGTVIARFLGRNIMNVITRLMGLLLAVIGIQLLITGLTSAFPILAR